MKITKLVLLATVAVLLVTGLASAQSVSERVDALKANVAESKATLHHYQWIQTTTVSLNGDVKSTKQERCYYGDDGSLQKVEISDEAAPQRQGLLFRRIKERKKEELTDYMKNAVSLVKSYVPPSPAKIQAAKENGNVTLKPAGSSRASIIFNNYELQGDVYSVEVNTASNRPVGLRVSTYLNDPSDVVKLNVVMGQLNNGTTFPSEITLNAENKGVTVNIRNSGYQRVN